MGRHYGQLSLGERHALFRLHEAGAAVSEIAGRLGRHRPTIYRELRRNRRASGEVPAGDGAALHLGAAAARLEGRAPEPPRRLCP
jgi:transposase, IS30 family